MNANWKICDCTSEEVNKVLKGWAEILLILSGFYLM